jgi:hypothetical protein
MTTVRVVFKQLPAFESWFAERALRRFVVRWNTLYEDLEGIKMRAKWIDHHMYAFADVASEEDAVIFKLKYQYFEV